MKSHVDGQDMIESSHHQYRNNRQVLQGQKQMSPSSCAFLKPSKSRAVLSLHTEHPKPGPSCAASALLLPTAAFRMIFAGQESRAAA